MYMLNLNNLINTTYLGDNIMYAPDNRFIEEHFDYCFNESNSFLENFSVSIDGDGNARHQLREYLYIIYKTLFYENEKTVDISNQIKDFIDNYSLIEDSTKELYFYFHRAISPELHHLQTV